MLLRTAIATIVVLTALLAAPRTAAAQGPGDTNIFGGYSFLHNNDADDLLSNIPGGFEVGLTHRLTGRMPLLSLGGKLQFSSTTVNSVETFTISQAMFGVLFGPPADMAKRVWVFGMVHVGNTHTSDEFEGQTYSANAFTVQPGAGVGLFLNPNLGLQLTAEVPIVKSEGTTSTGFRFGASVSVRLR
jgi:hypothetical protein